MDNGRTLWCFIEGDSTAFLVTPLGEASIGELKGLVWEMVSPRIWCLSSEGLADSSQLTSFLVAQRNGIRKAISGSC